MTLWVVVRSIHVTVSEDPESGHFGGNLGLAGTSAARGHVPACLMGSTSPGPTPGHIVSAVGAAACHDNRRACW